MAGTGVPLRPERVFHFAGIRNVTASVEAPTPQGNLSPELVHLVSMLRGWNSAKVKRLIRVLKVLENAPDDE